MCRVRKTPKFAVVIPTLLVLLGCGQESDESPGSYEIAVILLQEDQFFRLIEAGAKKAARRLGVQLSVNNSYGRIDREMELVETYVAKGVDAILVAPISQTATVPVLKNAQELIRAAADNVRPQLKTGKTDVSIKMTRSCGWTPGRPSVRRGGRGTLRRARPPTASFTYSATVSTTPSIWRG